MRAWWCTSSMAPTSCFATFMACAASTRAATGPSARSRASWNTILQMLETARRTSAWPPITSSNHSATTSGQATRPARASSRRCTRSSFRSRTHCGAWASPCGRWSNSRPTTPWPLRPASRPASPRSKGVHLDSGQGPRAMRLRVSASCRSIAVSRSATARACVKSSASSRRTSPTTSPSSATRGRLSRHPRHRPRRRGAPHCQVRRARGFPAAGARGATCARAAVQGPGNA